MKTNEHLNRLSIEKTFGTIQYCGIVLKGGVLKFFLLGLLILRSKEWHGSLSRLFAIVAVGLLFSINVYSANVNAGTSNSNWSSTSVGGTSYTSADNLLFTSTWNRTYNLTSNVECVNLTIGVGTIVNLNGYTLTVTGNMTLINNSVRINVGNSILSIIGSLSMTNYYSEGIFTSSSGLVELGGNLTANNNTNTMAGGISGFAGTLRFTGATIPTISLTSAPIAIATLDWDCKTPISLPSGFTAQNQINGSCPLNVFVSKSSLDGFTYIIGSGPSSSKSYVISGSNLIGDVSVFAPTDFEISFSSSTGYTNFLTLVPVGGILSTTTIYVRLKSGLPIGTYYNEKIAHTSPGSGSVSVACSGVVTCNTLPPSATSPVNYCTNEVATPLIAIGQNLLWEIPGATGNGSVGSMNFNVESHVWAATLDNIKLTYFTVHEPIILQSLTWAVVKNQSVNGVLIEVQNSDGSAIMNGTQTNGPVTVSAGSNLLQLTATFSNLTLTPGNYRVALVGGSGNFGLINNPNYPQTELSGHVSITGNSSSQLFTGFNFAYNLKSSTAPTPITSVQGTTYYYVTQTVAGCTSGPSTIEVNVSDAYCNMNTISTGAIVGSPFCPGASVSVPFTITGTFNAGNTFTAQLSDASGGFGSPQNIGSVVQTTAGTISAIIPANTPVGSGYRIRVVGNNPLILGTNNGSNLTVGLIPNAILAVNDASIECGQDGSIVMPVSESGVSYQLYLQDDVTPVAGTVVNGTGNSISFTVTPYVNTTYHVWATSNSGGCRVRLDDFPTMIVSPILVTVTDATQDPNSCPDFLEPFNANTDYYNAGSTLVSFNVARNSAPSSNWGFHFTLPLDSVYAPTGSFQTDIINVNTGPADLLVGVVEATVNVDQSISEVILRFHIVNTPGAAQSIQLQVDDLWDFNCTNPSINVSGTHSISAMPAIGGFN